MKDVSMLKLAKIAMFATLTLVGTSMLTAASVSALELSQDAEPQSSCYGYQPACYGYGEKSCCICSSNGTNCSWGCCH